MEGRCVRVYCLKIKLKQKLEAVKIDENYVQCIKYNIIRIIKCDHAIVKEKERQLYVWRGQCMQFH